ncbi:MAG: hypothetical protein GQ475_01315 [Methylococcaceae bacterium]|nr:hypothetical protein [Methylococcaceae bacterium]
MTRLKNYLNDNEKLIHSTMKKVESHVQRQVGSWIHNTVLLEDHDVPFKYKRQKKYRSLKGARVDLFYYPSTEQVAGIDFEVMNVVKINIS